jgi:isopentenyldiphosphate isomerase
MSALELIVDEDDCQIGARLRGDLRYEDIYRVSALWLTDIVTGDVLFGQRKLTKKNDPGKWASSVAGTVEEGETYDTNIVKEIEEEIGLTGLELKHGPKVFTDDGKHKFFCQWFLASIDKTTVSIKIQETEVEAVKWVSTTGLIKDVEQNPNAYVPSMLETLRIFSPN